MRQLAPVDIVAPGIRGLNSEEKNNILTPDFCTSATNFRIKDGKLLSVRKGWVDQTTTPITSTPNVESLHEYRKANGTVEIICAWDGGIGSGVADPEGNDISGSVTDTNGTWWFQDFNDKCLGFQSGKKLIVYNGTGTFATVVEAAGTAPTGGVASACYGRVWQVASDGSTINYCALLDETTWTGTGTGSIDMNNIWTDGQDTITAIAPFNGALVVFGKRHIVFFADASGTSALGLDPTNIYVMDVIAGAGCIDQQSVQLMGETDIAFLSTQGVMSLRRLIVNKSSEIASLTDKVRTQLLADVRSHTTGTVRTAYSEDEGIYLLTFVGLATYAIDMQYTYQDEWGKEHAPVFPWTLRPQSWAYRDNGDLLLGSAGVIGKYSGTTDNGTSIDFAFATPWMDLGEEFANALKHLKRLGMVFATVWGGPLVIKWAVDFEPQYRSKIIDVALGTSVAEWGTAEWGTAEWGGTSSLRIIKTPARHSGQYYKLVLSATVNQAFDLQQIELKVKMGRTA